MKDSAKELERIIRPVAAELAAVKSNYSHQLKWQSEPIRGIGSYLSKAHGKFFRPTLVLLSAKLGEGDMEKAVSLGVAIELIHAASLVHDDIIDEAVLRRSQRTINSKWGNAVSVIAGDYLLARAFDIVSKLDEPGIMTVFSKTAARMCEGELAQLANAYNFDITEDDYLDIIKRKSAYLISDCCAAGGMLGRLSEDKINRLAAYGLYLGVAFQITDDCLDLVGEESQLGKTVWQDMEKGKLTLPIIFLLKNAGRKGRMGIVELITSGGKSSHRILREKALSSGAISRSKGIASDYVKLAKKKLADGDGMLRKTFCEIADYVLERKS
ncbi:MAG: polyprenyl synthetase family protein [Candidatus Omnitrophica bacterium]|nr:polyprenyl synthetase family protein [Candidatus Omnitrophota bacterium]MDD5311306.1 polyprenyl synthetase family protein [Candidatus Omnitrophota bacterium]